MKKIITLSLLSMLIFSFAAPVIYAAPTRTFGDDLPANDDNQNSDQMSGGITITASQVPNIINKIARWLYTIVLALSVIFGLYAAFLYLTGNPKNVEKAKKQLIFAFVGVAVAIVAFSIEAIIRGIIR